MRKTYKPRHLLVKQFTQILFKHDLMGLNHFSQPHAEDNYDGEALSILARFTEGLLHGCQFNEALGLAYDIVQRAFTFWFNEPIQDEAKARELARELLVAFNAAYPSSFVEQPKEPGVVSET